MAARTRELDKPRRRPTTAPRAATAAAAAPPPSLEQRAARVLLLAALGNHTLAGGGVDVLDAVSATVLALGIDRLRAATAPRSPWPVRASLGLLGLRWLHSCGVLGAATDLSATARFATIVAQATLVAGAGLALSGA